MQQLLPTTEPCSRRAKSETASAAAGTENVNAGRHPTRASPTGSSSGEATVAGASEQLQEEARDNVDDKVPLVHGVPRL